jgi:hypothetical protein
MAVGGVRFFSGMAVDEYANGAIAFCKPVARIWQFWSGGIYLSLTSKGQRLPTGGRSRRRYFVDVCVGFLPSDRVAQKSAELAGLDRSELATRPLGERLIHYSVVAGVETGVKGIASVYKGSLTPQELADFIEGLTHIGEEDLAGEIRRGFELLKEDGFYEHMNWKKVSAPVKAEVDVIGKRIGDRLGMWHFEDKLAALLDDGDDRRTNG